MILTGLAKEDFISFMCKTYPNIRWHDYENMTDSMINALIIEWFDSVGIYVNAIRFNDNWKFIVDFVYKDRKYRTRQEALIFAITKANEIYNTSN